MKREALLRVLKRAPLAYDVLGDSKGSHLQLRSPNGYKPLTFAFHPGTELGPIMVKKVLCGGVGLTPQEAMRILRG